MNFWMRNILFGILLAVVAYVLLANQTLLGSFSEYFSSGGDSAQIDEQENNEENDEEIAKNPDVNTKKVNKPKKSGGSSNAAADGLSRFYASINPTFDESGPRIKNNIVYLPEPKGDLSDILKARKKVVSPMRKSWRGDVDSRPFRVGQTLYQKLSEYAEKEGVEVIWWLNRDFVVKDPFRIDKDVLKTAYQIGKAVAGHFPEGIDIYFCYKHRTIVLTDKPNGYLVSECTLVGADSSW